MLCRCFDDSLRKFFNQEMIERLIGRERKKKKENDGNVKNIGIVIS